MMNLSLKTLVLSGLTVGALAIACNEDSLIYEGQPCPCADGYECCDGECMVSCDGDRTSSSPSGDPAIVALAADMTPVCMSLDPSNVFWMTEDGRVAGASTVTMNTATSRPRLPIGSDMKGCTILRSGDGLYVTSTSSSAIHWLSVSFDGAMPVIGERLETFATMNRPTGLVEDDASVYALDGDNGEVRRFAKRAAQAELDAGTDAEAGSVPDASTPTADAGALVSSGTLLGTGSGDAYALMLDGDSLFWFDRTGLRRMPKAGGAIATVAPPPESGKARELQAGGGSLYWLEGKALMTVPIAGGVAHAMVYTPVDLSTDTGDDEEVRYRQVDSFAASDHGLILAHTRTVGLVDYQGGEEVRLFSYGRHGASSSEVGMYALTLDTFRYLWITGNRTSIELRPVLETDPKLVAR